MKLKFKIVNFILIFLSILFTYAKAVDIRILYLDDFHGFAESYKPFGVEKPIGGASVFTSILKKLKNEKTTLLASARDMIHGNNWPNPTEGRSVIKLINSVEFDAMLVGNHELDFGQEVLKKEYLRQTFLF
ncbi:MAG: hypothetical protein N3A59_04275 [Thermodesulfovibrionales bacterium]|nr:hypothetical protein [Thermodesulfovibrionales bacterium]